MNKFIVTSIVAMIMSAVIAGCQKKDDSAPPAGPSCLAGQLFSTYANNCVAVGQCPRGLVQNYAQPSMCMNPQTGENVMTQQCGTGYVLTVNGCVPPCPGRPGWGLSSNACIEGISVGGYYNQGQQQQQGTGQQMPYYNNNYYQQQQGYPYSNPYWYRGY